MHLGKPVLNRRTSGQWYIHGSSMYLLSVPSVSSRYFNKIKTKVLFREIARLIARNSLQWSNRNFDTDWQFGMFERGKDKPKKLL